MTGDTDRSHATAPEQDTTPTGQGATGPEAGSDDTVAVPWRSPTVQVVLLSTVLAPLGVPLVAPALPVVRDAFAISNAEASLLVSTYFLTGIVLSPFIGLLADRVGRRRVLLPSLAVFGVTGIAMVAAPSFAALLGLRVVQGTAAAGIFITTVTVVGDVYEGARRNAVLGVNNAALSAGAAVFPVLGGALAAVAWNAPFAVYALALPVTLFAAWKLPEPSVVPSAGGLGYLRGALATVEGTEAAVLYVAAFTTELLLFGAILTGLPFHMTAVFGLAPVVVGLVLTASEVTSTVVSAGNGRLARRFSDDQLVAMGFLAYGAGFLGLWVAPTALAIAAATALFGVGMGLSMPSVDAALSATVAAEFRGGALSLRNSMTFLGRSAGPVAFTLLVAVTSFDGVLLASSVVALAVAVAALLVVRSQPAARGPAGEPV